MSTLRCFLPWIAALALGVLGWYAMVPIWTQGLGLVALDADFHPALWLAAAKVMVVLGGGVFILRAIAMFRSELRLEPLLRKGLILGIGLYLAALVLFFALVGQPLRVWFLVAQWEWGNPLCRAILGFVVCLLSLFFGFYRGVFKYVIAFSGFGAFILLVSQLSPILPVVHGRLVPPTPQDWLVLAFALGCGAYASWLRARENQKCSEVASQ